MLKLFIALLLCIASSWLVGCDEGSRAECGDDTECQRDWICKGATCVPPSDVPPLWDTLKVDADGVTQSEHSDLIDGFSAAVGYGHGYVYATTGEVVDVRDPTRPIPAGRFPFPGTVLPLSDDSALVLSAEPDSRLTLRRMSTETFTEMGSVRFAGGSGVPWQPSMLVRVGPGTLAFTAASGRYPGGSGTNVYIVKDVALAP